MKTSAKETNHSMHNCIQCISIYIYIQTYVAKHTKNRGVCACVWVQRVFVLFLTFDIAYALCMEYIQFCLGFISYNSLLLHVHFTFNTYGEQWTLKWICTRTMTLHDDFSVWLPIRIWLNVCVYEVYDFGKRKKNLNEKYNTCYMV